VEEIIVALLATTIKVGTCLLLGSLGEIFAERSGVMNLGVEGMMIIGALTGFSTLILTGNPWIAILIACAAGGLLSLIHAFLSITLRINQILSGLLLSMFGLGVSGVLGRPLIGVSAHGLGFAPFPIPVLSSIPYIGPILFQHDPLVYISYLLVPISWIILFKTEFGLSVRAVGENPAVADTLGINVYLIRYICVFIGGVLAGMAGAHLSIAYNLMWIEGMTAGRGYIVIALTIFSFWNPLRAVIGAYLFGGVGALQYVVQGMGIGIPPEFLLMAPYLLTIIALLITSWESIKKRIGPPASLYKPYVREERGA